MIVGTANHHPEKLCVSHHPLQKMSWRVGGNCHDMKLSYIFFFGFGGYGVVFFFALRTRIEGLFVHIFYYYDHSVTHTHTNKRRNNNIYAVEKISIG